MGPRSILTGSEISLTGSSPLAIKWFSAVGNRNTNISKLKLAKSPYISTSEVEMCYCWPSATVGDSRGCFTAQVYARSVALRVPARALNQTNKH